MEGDNNRSLFGKVFGKEASHIPCLRSSLMQGIGGGIGLGLINFLTTSNVQQSTRRAFAGYILITVASWGYCRYNIAVTKFNEQILKDALKQQKLQEQAEFERKLDKDSHEI